MQNVYLRWPTVHEVSALSRVTVWRMERDGTFPRRRQLAANSVGWLKSEVDAWVDSRAKVTTTQAGAV